MLYFMLACATMAFFLLGLAKRAPDPYWQILLHSHEAFLAAFLFCAMAVLMRTIENTPKIIFRGRTLNPRRAEPGAWKPMLALLMSVTALTYRIAVPFAHAAFQNSNILHFDPWATRGNVFALTLAAISAVLGLARIRHPVFSQRVVAIMASVFSLLSFAPLLMPAYPPYHPFSLALAAGAGLILWTASRFIQRRWGVL